MAEAGERNGAVRNDEIDLLELLQAFWNGRYILLACCLAGVVLAGIYAITAKQQWTSVAFVSEPHLEQIGAYLDQRRAMARVDGNRQVDTETLAATLFNGFVSQAVARKNRLDYLSGTDYYRKRIAGIDDPSAACLLLTGLADQLQIKAFNDQIAPYYQFGFSAETAEQAQELLAGYLSTMNDLSFKLVDESFNNHLDAEILSRQTELANIEFKLEAERRNQIEILENALHAARLADIPDYVMARRTEGATVIELSNSNRLFMLGEKYLTAELETARDMPLIYPPRYYEMARELEQLKPLRQYDIKTLSYSYQLPPTLPVKPDKPQRTLIVILGALGGGFVGVFWLLASMSLRRKNVRVSPRFQA